LDGPTYHVYGFELMNPDRNFIKKLVRTWAQNISKCRSWYATTWYRWFKATQLGYLDVTEEYSWQLVTN